MLRNRLDRDRTRDDRRQWVQDRRARTRHLIELGGLVQKAGLVELVDDDRATLLGAFLELAARLQGQENEHQGASHADLMTRWRRRGLRAFDADKDAAETVAGGMMKEAGQSGIGARMTAKQIRIAASVDMAMQPFMRAGQDDIAMLAGMGEHMTDFKYLIDTAKSGVMDELCQRYPGFYRYAKVLENIAGAIHSGAIKVPR